MSEYLGYYVPVLKQSRRVTRFIIPLGKGRFIIKYPFVYDFELNVDFSPFEVIFDLKPPYGLVHWQARPKGYRVWGVYLRHPDSEEYKALEWENMPSGAYLHQFLQIDEDLIHTQPTAVIHYPVIPDSFYA